MGDLGLAAEVGRNQLLVVALVLVRVGVGRSCIPTD